MLEKTKCKDGSKKAEQVATDLASRQIEVGTRECRDAGMSALGLIQIWFWIMF